MSGNSNDGSVGPLAFIVGGLVVAAGIGIFLFTGGYLGGHTSTTTERVTITAPSVAAPATSTTTTTTERK